MAAALLLLIAVPLASCIRRPARAVVPSPSPGLSSYETAEQNFDASNYQAAAKGYEACLRAGFPDNQDRVHFRLGLAYVLAPGPQNLPQAKIHLQRVATAFPNSPYRIAAQLILSLQAEVEKLAADSNEQQTKIKMLIEELQRLKDIDMKRHPSRPPP